MASRTQCLNTLTQIGLALQIYAGVNGAFPPGNNNWTHLSGTALPTSQYEFWSWRALLMPYLQEDGKLKWAERLMKVGSLPPPLDPAPSWNPPDPQAWLYAAVWDGSGRYFGDSSGRYLGPFALVNPVFSCPSDSRTLQPVQSEGWTVAVSSYLAVNGIDLWSWSTGTPTGSGALRGVMVPTNKKYQGQWGQEPYHCTLGTRMTEISDGTSTTLLVGERPPSHGLDFGWTYACTFGQDFCGTLDATLGVNEINLQQSGVPDLDACGPGPYYFSAGRIDNPCDAFHFWSLHPGGANFLFADGSACFLSYTVGDKVMRALATMSNDDAVELP
jgi:prepilin-type processing-associated H-X9-DG protein